MHEKQSPTLSETVENHALYLAQRLRSKAKSIGFQIPEEEYLDILQRFRIRCWEICRRYRKSGGAGIKTYLGNATVFEPERYLRERNRKKRLLLREARPLEYENGREIDADEHSDFLSGLMFREEFERKMESLEPQERELVEALIDAEGNLSRAAGSFLFRSPCPDGHGLHSLFFPSVRRGAARGRKMNQSNRRLSRRNKTTIITPCIPTNNQTTTPR